MYLTWGYTGFSRAGYVCFPLGNRYQGCAWGRAAGNGKSAGVGGQKQGGGLGKKRLAKVYQAITRGRALSEPRVRKTRYQIFDLGAFAQSQKSCRSPRTFRTCLLDVLLMHAPK